MKKYNEEYFSILDKKTGKKLFDCGDEMDAISMVNFDPQNRTYTRNKFLMGPVVDIQMPKALPTTNVSKSSVPQEYFDSMYPGIPDDVPIVLPEGQGQPVRV